MSDNGDTLVLEPEKGKIAVVNLIETAVINAPPPEHEGYFGVHGKQRIKEPENIVLIDGGLHKISSETASPQDDNTTEVLIRDQLPDSSRPLTDVARDHIELDGGHPEDQEKTVARRNDNEKDPRSSPISVKIDNKFASSRTYSDYTLKSSNTGIHRQHIIPPGQAIIDVLPTPDITHHGMKAGRANPRLIRLATVTMSSKSKPTIRGPSLYYEDPRKPLKVIRWDQAMDCRPPLRIDMEGPGPWTYSPRNKPLNETNSPKWTFGGRCYPEKEGGSRTSWEKSWFQSSNVWQKKVDFLADASWPTPNQYRQRALLGPRQKTVPEAPSFTIGVRKNVSLLKRGVEKEPSPSQYNRSEADTLVLKRGPSFTHQFRRQGSLLWASTEITPGPAAYSPSMGSTKQHRPSFTIQGMRREKSHILGPYASF